MLLVTRHCNIITRHLAQLNRPGESRNESNEIIRMDLSWGLILKNCDYFTCGVVVHARNPSKQTRQRKIKWTQSLSEKALERKAWRKVLSLILLVLEKWDAIKTKKCYEAIILSREMSSKAICFWLERNLKWNYQYSERLNEQYSE